MGFLTAAILSGVVYDMLKNGLALSSGNLKVKLREWTETELIAPKIEKELGKLKITDEMSETAIERVIEQSSELVELLRSIKKDTSNGSVTQHHSGSGDNVGRDKVYK